MFRSCCERCRRKEDLDEKEVIVKKTVPEENSAYTPLDSDAVKAERRPETELPGLTKEALKRITLDVWKRGQHGVTMSVFANADLTTAFSAVFKITSGLNVIVTRLVDSDTPGHLTVVEFPLSAVAALYEGPCLRTPSAAAVGLEDGAGDKPAANELDWSAQEELLARSLQLVLSPPKGGVHSVCLICTGVKERRELFGALSVLKYIAIKRTRNEAPGRPTKEKLLSGKTTGAEDI
ncbi:hypothetical protein GNI_107460 [Gregarina niphandrodes]|uniref:Uncharacterized protein n=1 Tax=Gregarina niphandrodes TaxID=110365 RepID=A0A023B3T6_GRENI|nr:hypothetical protein GNI_107460 [Gregarina niphandrodes]EZG55913.1 hypothetical protein GNI_107460 [Gregarina niphandrodes]|eukprot:XP_011131420.1 hypothetical protein GNI_107460 [Gregarina niphandrodes]